MDAFSLKSKTCLITGGAGILGHHFVKALLDNGANVAIVDFSDDSLEKLDGELKTNYSSESYSMHRCDVTNEEEVKKLVDEVHNIYGSIDVLHNNAASKSSNLDRFFDPYGSFDVDIWREILDVNLTGYFLMTKHVGNYMINHNIKGSIIQTASIYGVAGPDQRIYEGSEYLGRQISSPGVYSASKAGVVGLTKFLATYWGEKGIRVNTITPGGVESGQNETFKSKYSQRVPLGRMARPSEMTGALIFLASDASSYINGQNIIVDGGLTAW